MAVFPRPKTLREYQALASLTDRGSGSKKPSFAALGFFGESGSVLTEVKKKQRDALTFRSYHDIVLEEIGDALWYLSTIATRALIDLDDVALDAAALFNPDFVSERVEFDPTQPATFLGLIFLSKSSRSKLAYGRQAAVT